MEHESFCCDLSARLHPSTRLYERQIEDRWLLYAPDRPGMPVLVHNWAHELLNSFHDGKTVGDVLASRRGAPQNLEDFVCTIGFLEERGFLRNQRNPEQYGVSREPYDAFPKQISVWLHINNGCNLACRYCFVQDQSNEIMTPEILRLSVERIASTVVSNNITEVVLKLAGGEPTLAVASLESAYDQLTAALRGTKTTVQAVVLSNGTVVNERIVDFLRRPGVGIGISIDGLKNYHDVHRVYKNGNGGSWDVIARNVARLLESGIKPYIMTTLTKESSPGLTGLAEWIFSQGLATRVNIVRPPEPPCYGLGQKVNEYAAIAAACTEAFSRLFSMIEEWRIPIDVANQLHICELSFDYPLNGPACGMGRSHIVMDHHGDMADCVMNVHAARTRASGNLLSDVRKTTAYLPYERGSATGHDPCTACQWFPVCAGGCPTANTAVNGHPYTQSPLCDFFKFVIPRYLDCLGKWMLHNERTTPAGSPTT